MIGIVVISHGDMANGLLSSVEILNGKAENVTSLGLFPENSSDEFEEKLRETVRSVDTGDGILVLTDLNGGTTTNKALALALERNDMEVFAGINLPMLLEAIACREYTPMSDICEVLMEVAKETVVHASAAINKTENSDASDDELDDLMD